MLAGRVFIPWRPKGCENSASTNEVIRQGGLEWKHKGNENWNAQAG